VGKRGPLATNRPRHWQVESNMLTLSTDNGHNLTVAVWRKEP
jgi:hypothetical protein